MIRETRSATPDLPYSECMNTRVKIGIVITALGVIGLLAGMGGLALFVAVAGLALLAGGLLIA